jgi:hypothetical protein
MGNVRSLVLVLLPVAVLVACSSDKSSSNAFIEQYCSLLRPCCQPSTTGAGGADPGSGCVAFYSLFGGGAYDAATGDACLDEIRAHQSELTFCSNVPALAPSCDKALASKSGGTKAPGETCSSSRDCAPSSDGKVTCTFGATGDMSICQLVIDGKAGDSPCIGTKSGSITNKSGSGPAPARGFTCNLANDVWCNAKSGACEATRNVGDACASGDPGSCGAKGECSAMKCVTATPSTTAPIMDPSLLIVCSTKSN